MTAGARPEVARKGAAAGAVGRRVDFYFGLGSRYSYLAAARIASLREEGASIRWRPLYSPDLIRAAGSDPFAVDGRRGQYLARYRTVDAVRWAAHLGVPYHEPEFDAVDWLAAALWAVAAQELTGGPDLARRLLERTFAEGRPPMAPGDLREEAQSLGLDVALVEEAVSSGAASVAHDRSVSDALAAGAFGVPTFVVDDGALFWGQDRVPLLVDHLRAGSKGVAEVEPGSAASQDR